MAWQAVESSLPCAKTLGGDHREVSLQEVDGHGQPQRSRRHRVALHPRVRAIVKEAQRKSKAAPLDAVTASSLEDRTTRGILVDADIKDDRPGDREFLDRVDAEHFEPKSERIAREYSPANTREYQGTVRGDWQASRAQSGLSGSAPIHSTGSLRHNE
jgi:hypothetical protein